MMEVGCQTFGDRAIYNRDIDIAKAPRKAHDNAHSSRVTALWQGWQRAAMLNGASAAHAYDNKA